MRLYLQKGQKQSEVMRCEQWLPQRFMTWMEEAPGSPQGEAGNVPQLDLDSGLHGYLQR